MESSTPSYTDKLPHFTGSYGKLILQKLHKEKDHLGNVLATVSDRKVGEDRDGDDRVERYWSQVMSTQSYYPMGGMLMPGTRYKSGMERYKYQDQEDDKEIYGAGNLYAYKYRMSDARLGGQFWSVDPLFRKYPGWSPYAFSQRRVIDGIELEGLEYFGGPEEFMRVYKEAYRKAKKDVDVKVEMSTIDKIQHFWSRNIQGDPENDYYWEGEKGFQRAQPIIWGTFGTLTGGVAFGAGLATGASTSALAFEGAGIFYSLDETVGGIANESGQPYTRSLLSEEGKTGYDVTSGLFNLRGGYKSMQRFIESPNLFDAFESFQNFRGLYNDVINQSSGDAEPKSVEEMKSEQAQWEQSMDTYVEESTRPENLTDMMNN